jgi:hypothetical protein
MRVKDFRVKRTWLFDVGRLFLYYSTMGKIYTGDGWIIKVQGNEHPPVHVHVLHPEGKAAIGLDGAVKNSGVPLAVIKAALAWVATHNETVRAEWARMNEPRN